MEYSFEARAKKFGEHYYFLAGVFDNIAEADEKARFLREVLRANARVEEGKGRLARKFLVWAR